MSYRKRNAWRPRRVVAIVVGAAVLIVLAYLGTWLVIASTWAVYTGTI